MAFAMNLRKPLAGDPGTAAAARIDPPARAAADSGYDPLASVSLLEHLRTSAASGRAPWKVPLIGHLPIARQFHVLGVLLVTFLVFAAFVMAFDVRTAAQAAASTATATEMQMLSQRLSSSSTLALQGHPVAFEAVKDTRERFKADLDALQRGGTLKGVTLDAVQDDAQHLMLQGIKTRWDRVDSSVGQLLDNEQRLTDVAKGSATVAQGSKQLVEMSQRASQQGASQREVEYANQLALLSQRIAKNTAALVSSPESDPELAALLARDAGAFRDAQSGLARGGSEPAPRASAARPEESSRVVAIELARLAAAFDAGLAAVLQHTARLVSGETGGARDHQRSRRTARANHAAHRYLQEHRQVEAADVVRDRVFAARARHAAAARQGVLGRRPGAGVRKRSGEQA